ncbi:MAG TPA: hypothetical protein PKZ36_00980 [Candidatus Paceibacterota bacterium]|nr:hypothetical protein [Candidatus Paceibacterota bacterium]HPT17965.1 hypothetical protein [Candidatus Paceibacterota bacterium]
MINLIPIEEKKKIKIDFYFRLLSVFFVVLSFSILISSVSIMPAYISSLEKKNSVNKKLEAQKSEVMPEIDKQAQVAIKDLNTRLSVIEKAISNKYVFSQNIINEVLLKQETGIKITRIFYENDKFKGRVVTVSGIASSRQQLLLFRKAFENSGAFKSIDLPISNFVKGSDIQFTLNLVAI